MMDWIEEVDFEADCRLGLGVKWLFVPTFGVIFLLLALNVVLGPLNQDEGWYLYAASQVAEGGLPYRDFAFTQGPMLPLVFSWLTPVVEQWGVLGGRVMNALFGLMATLLAGLVAMSLSRGALRGWAGLVAVMLAGVNVYQTYFLGVVKTYSLCAFFFMLGLWAFCFALRHPTRLASGLAGVAWALAASTRLSAGMALLVGGLILLGYRRRLGDRNWLAYGLGGGFVLLGLWLPFYLMAPKGFLFGLFEYHTQREAGSLLTVLALKGGFVSRVVQAYFVAAVLLLLALCFVRKEKGVLLSLAPLWVLVLAVTGLHVAAPFPYDDYQVYLFPAVAALLGAGWARVLPRMSLPPCRTALVLLCVLFASSFSSPMNQEWVSSGRDRVWWKMKVKPDVLLLREVGTRLREEFGVDALLLSQDTYLAVESGMSVPRGMEMGVFSYYPEMSDEDVARLKLMNREYLLRLIRSGACSVAAFSEYGFCVRSPEVTELSAAEQGELQEALEECYELFRVVDDFGQGHTRLRLYRLK